MGRTQDGHLTIRCAATDAERIRKAASKAHQSLTEFLVSSAIDRCKVIEAGMTIVHFEAVETNGG